MNQSKDNPGFVTEKFCNERFSRVSDKLDEVKGLLQEIKEDKKEEGHFWRNFLGTVVGGGLVAFFAWLLSTFPH
jgi:hypothetical protein